MLSEIINGQSVVRGHSTYTRRATTQCHIEVKSITDCRSLYDALQKVAPSIDEKRTLIDVLGIKETVGRDGVNWMPTDKQLADALTKIDFNLSMKLVQWLGRPVLCLRKASEDASIPVQVNEDPFV